MPIPLIILCALLLLFILLLFLRVRLTVTYKETVCAELQVLFLRIRLFPRRKKLKLRKYSKKRLARAEQKKLAAAQKKAKKKARREAQHKKKKRTLQENIRLVRALSAALIRRTHKHLRLHAARLHVRVATGDAATTAVLYGSVSGSLSLLLAGLDRVTRLKAVTPDVSVAPDFLAERSVADIKLVFSLRVWGAIATALSVGIAFLRATPRKKQPNPKRKQSNSSPKKGT